MTYTDADLWVCESCGRVLNWSQVQYADGVCGDCGVWLTYIDPDASNQDDEYDDGEW